MNFPEKENKNNFRHLTKIMDKLYPFDYMGLDHVPGPGPPWYEKDRRINKFTFSTSLIIMDGVFAISVYHEKRLIIFESWLDDHLKKVAYQLGARNHYKVIQSKING